jgi:DNA-binding CsgD family transcriptional regulator
MRSHAHYRRGELADAEADAQGALDASGEGWFTAPVGFLADALIERGELEAAEAAFVRYDLTDALFPNLLVANLLLDARGRLRCAQGRYEEGLADLLAVGERLQAWDTANPAVISWRSSAALAHAALGERDVARKLTDEELPAARAFGAPRALGVALRAAGLVREGSVGIELLREAVSVLEGSAARLEHARALTDLGAILRRDGRRTEAREPLRRGLDLADRCGADALAARAREELVTAGARPRRERISGAEALTASEHRIATLAATGMTNREIAQALFITIKTVKAHLGHVFQKLDITARSELPDALAGTAQDAA